MAENKINKIVFYHLKVIFGAVVITLLFSVLLTGKFIHSGSLTMLGLTFFQLELFLWLGTRFFHSIKPSSDNLIQKTSIRFLLFFVSVMGIALLLFMAVYTFFFIREGGEFSQFFEGLFNKEMKGFLIAASVGFAFGALIFFYMQWTAAVKHMHKLKEEKLIFQYETLKSQVNPHFLFNSLNTLSSLLPESANRADEFIQKLAAVYRYILENKEKNMVSVHDEIAFVKDYFYLQKIRDEDKIELKIEIPNDVEMEVVPVSLQMLVENALKHNQASRKQPLEIFIGFDGEMLEVKNQLRRKSQLQPSSEIGLKNLNARCELLLKKEIQVQETVDEFAVKIPVEMSTENE